MFGKVPFQIKGTEKIDFSKDKIAFIIEVSDLRNYYYDGGAVCFVVYINKNTSSHKIYYISLLPYDLNIMLNEANGQKSKTIYLSEYPENNPDEITNIFMEFLSNRPKQMSYINKKIPSLEELEQQGVEIESVSFGVTGIGIKSFDIEKFVTTHEFYLYAKPKGLDIEIPIEKVSHSMMSREVCAPILAGGKQYYPRYFVVFWEGEPTIKIGKSVSVKIHGKKPVVNFKLNGNLAERIKDTEFMLAVMDQKFITIKNITIPLSDIDEAFQNGLLSHFEHLKRVRLMLEQLGVHEELDCNNLSDQDEHNIRKLISAMIYHKNISFESTETIHYGIINIANLAIMMWVHKQEDGLYSVENFFNIRRIIYFSDSTEITEHTPASQFLLMRKENFLHISNIDYDKIYSSLIETQPSKLFFSHAILLLLEMLKAYDEQKEKDSGLLTLAEKFCNWIAENDFANESAIMLLNKLQIVKRKRPLTLDELGQLTNLKGTNQPDSILCGANILLENLDDAKKYFGCLSEDERKEFINYPICHFWWQREKY